MACRFDELQVGDHPGADAFNFSKARRLGAHDLGKAAEASDQGLGERLHVPAWNGAEQGEFEKLVVRERVGAPLREAGAQTVAMPDVIRLRRLRSLTVRCVGSGRPGDHGTAVRPTWRPAGATPSARG